MRRRRVFWRESSSKRQDGYNHGGKSFTNLAFALRTAEVGKSHGVTFADYDGDGDLDVYVPVGGFTPGDAWTNRLFRNESRVGNSLTVRLRGTRSNRDGIGARVEVSTGTLDYVREVTVGGGFGSTNQLDVHCGLGPESRAKVVIRWPSGVVQNFAALDAGFRYGITEGAADVRRQPYRK